MERATRRDGYKALIAHGVFGRDRLLDELQSSLGGPYSSGIRKAFIWGSGGVGKSTVLAAIADRLLDRDPQAAIVHLDFDRSDLDPLRTYTLDLELLQQAGTVTPSFDKRLKAIANEIRKSLGPADSRKLARYRSRGTSKSGKTKRRTVKSAAAHEGFSAQSKSEMFGALRPLRAMRKPLILILDTFEQIEAAGRDHVESVERWIATLGRVTGIEDFRVVACSRNDPGSTGSFLSARASGWNVTELTDLFPSDARKMLVALKVPDQLAEEVTSSLPGNPLVLQLVADIFVKLGPQVLVETTKEVRRRRISGALVQGVLYDRILKHIGNDDARLYAHPGLVLPIVTPELIKGVLAPVMEPKASTTLRRAGAIFDALAETSWLVTRSPDGKSLTQRRDLRQLMLQLMRADAKGRAQVAEIRKRAITYHRGRAGPSHRAFALYHRMMDVRKRSELAAFDKYNYSGIGPVLRPHLGDLSEVARTYLAERIGQRVGSADAREQLSDRSWERYLAGDGDKQGEGDRLVERADPMVALDLWRSRPVGPRGRPPTFVIQALADTAEWSSDDVDIAAVVEELAATFSANPSQWRMPLRRLYWLTRYALMAAPGPLQPHHRDLLHRVLATNKLGPGTPISVLPALASVATAFAGDASSLVPERYLTAKGIIEGQTRIYLVHGMLQRRPINREPHMSDLMTLQRDWSERVHESAWRFVAGGAVVGGADAVKKAQAAIDKMDGAPLASVSKLLGTQNFTIEVAWDGRSVEPGILLLRGSLSEFYRPVRQALREALKDEETVLRVLDKVRPAFTIWPADFEPTRIAVEAVADPVSTFLSIAKFADQARVLETLMTAACEVAPRSAKLERVTQTFVKWDRAICGGRSSSWWSSRDFRQGRTRR